MEMQIRAAAINDLDAVVAAYAWLFEPPGSMPPAWDPVIAKQRLRDTLDGQRSHVLVADAGDAIVGICTVYLDIVSVRFGQRAWIEDLATDPASRSHGVGTQLMDAACQWARERGATHIELDSGDARLRAHQFYEARRPSWTSRCFGWLLT